MSRKGPAKVSHESVPTHPATRAWTSEFGSGAEILGITTLTNKHKSSVFRLELRGWIRDSAVAKVCTEGYGAITCGEERMYREVLPSAGLPSVEVYGHLVDPSARSFWLFLEDLGDQVFESSCLDDCRLLAEWLAALHQWVGFTHSSSEWSDRGPDHYLQHLYSARTLISNSLSQTWVSERSRTALLRLRGFLDRLEEDWGRLDAVCRLAPRTIVHGDLVDKNVRFRTRGGARELVVLDWEMMGLGIPSVDLKLLGDDLEGYAARMQALRPSMSPALVKALANIGQIFRSLVVLDWKACDLPYEWCSLESFESFESRLEADLRRAHTL